MKLKLTISLLMLIIVSVIAVAAQPLPSRAPTSAVGAGVVKQKGLDDTKGLIFVPVDPRMLKKWKLSTISGAGKLVYQALDVATKTEITVLERRLTEIEKSIAKMQGSLEVILNILANGN